jgi:hypothetical protein
MNIAHMVEWESDYVTRKNLESIFVNEVDKKSKWLTYFNGTDFELVIKK